MNEETNIYYKLWRAAQTVHWFATGVKDVYASRSEYTTDIAVWYVNVENEAYEKYGDV